MSRAVRSSFFIHLLVSISVSLSLVSCKKENAGYCEQTPTPSDCPQPDMGSGCTSDDECPGQVCDIGAGACVQCTPANAAACTAATPVCDPDDRACRGCEAHSECPSDACLPDGTCALDTQVAYVAASGASTQCTQSSPCALLAT
ncbi:MAG: hypothetical protein SFX73_18950, partial [Kofleriaceae bacterium]|nr:hypothetical protein [Kofleriaceae bacterium]